MKRILFIIIAVANFTAGQQVYEIPFASQNNSIELAIENTNDYDLSDVNISVEAPEWIKFDKELINLSKIESFAGVNTEFNFSVDKYAGVNENTVLKFIIESDFEQWSKNITITVLPPKELKLEQNYPNPFNPSTVIEYRLPEKAKVDVSIYNVLGELAAHLISGIQEPGLHKLEWNAEKFASGIYIYQVYVQGKEDRFLRKKMLLVK